MEQQRLSRMYPTLFTTEFRCPQQRKQLGCWTSYARRIKGLVLSNDSKSRTLCWSSRRTEIHPNTVASSDPHRALNPSLESKNSSTIVQPAEWQVERMT